MANSKVITTDTFLKKSLSRGKMNLNFEINTGIKTDMVDFLELLKEGVSIIEEEIKKYGKK